MERPDFTQRPERRKITRRMVDRYERLADWNDPRRHLDADGQYEPGSVAPDPRQHLDADGQRLMERIRVFLAEMSANTPTVDL